MFRVLIADDESSVIQSLMFSMPWEELELEVAGTASDGNAALEMAQKEDIDIAILDIRMPGINGLELCERLKQQREQIQLIIASGYAEFAYAEKAIQYGVLGYCLKPLDYTQMTRFLRKAVQNLKRDRHIQKREDLMEILERREEGEIRECLSGLGFQGEKYFLAASIGEKKLDEMEYNGISLRFGRGQWGYIMRTSPAGRLENQGGHRLSGCLGIGYLQQAVNGGEIYEAFEECIARAYQYFVCGEDKICAELDEGRSKGWLNAIQEKSKAGDRDGVDRLLEEAARDAGRDFTVRGALRLWNMVCSLSISREEDDYYIYSVEQLVNTYGSFQEMIEQLRRFLKENSTQAEESKAFTNVTFMKLMKYINDNYREEISLTSAAQVLHMNSNYVSQLFKKEAGVTFVHYITQKRLEDAKELLVTTQKPLTDIALEVGFNDTFHFIKTFKKFTGMTPGQYRTNN